VALSQRDITINRFHRELILNAVTTLGWKLNKQQARFGVFGHQAPITKEYIEVGRINDEDISE
jgi:hypothetical protein